MLSCSVVAAETKHGKDAEMCATENVAVQNFGGDVWRVSGQTQRDKAMVGQTLSHKHTGCRDEFSSALNSCGRVKLKLMILKKEIDVGHEKNHDLHGQVNVERFALWHGPRLSMMKRR